MISNLRARPIQGFVTDSAGNVIRNASITIYRSGPNGLEGADAVNSDDEGYFISNPLPNGVYDVFESGIRTSRIIHTPDNNDIQAFKASTENYLPNNVKPFSWLVDHNTLNAYQYFLQIEPEDISVNVLGSMFPLYDFDISTSNVAPFKNIRTFFRMTSDSRITVSRFDIEFFSPLTATQTSYKRIRWAGVPGIRFKKDSKIVVPLDYYSIAANMPAFTSNSGVDYTTEVNVDSSTAITGSSEGSYPTILGKIGIGDILKLKLTSTTNFYGIVLGKSGNTITLEKWGSSRYTNTDMTRGSKILLITLYHGIFQGLSSMSSTVSDYFSVFENVSQQNSDSELYTYPD